jgi:hypothetical protein
MPAVLKIDRQRRVVSSTFYGNVTGDDLLRHGARIKADPEFNPAFAEIVDFSGIHAITVPPEALERLASTESLFHHDAPHIVVTPADLPMNLALQYRDRVRETRPNFHVVRTVAEAKELLQRLGYDL